MLVTDFSKIVSPYTPEKVTTGISFGQGHYGYDLRLNGEISIIDNDLLDPKGRMTLSQYLADEIFVPLQTSVLVTTLERISIPGDCLGFIVGKSTYARLGLIVNCTPLEPDWTGFPTICLVNPTLKPIRLYPKEGIAQLVLFEGGRKPHSLYTGGYQNAEGIQCVKPSTAG